MLIKEFQNRIAELDGTCNFQGNSLRVLNLREKLFRGLCILLFVAFVLPSTAFAMSGGPPHPAEPWQMELGDDLVFHMTPPDYEAYGYKPSGLYLDGIPVYLVEGYARGDIHFSNDGLSFIYIASMQRSWDDILWLRDVEPDGLVFFFEQGQFVHVFTQQDMKNYTDNNPILFGWRDSRIHDPENNTLQTTTRWLAFSDYRAFDITFDLSSGGILSVYKLSFFQSVLQDWGLQSDIAYFVYVAALFLVPLIIAFVVMRRNKRKRRLQLELYKCESLRK